MVWQWQAGKSNASGTWAEAEKPLRPQVGIAPPSVPGVGERARGIDVLAYLMSVVLPFHTHHHITQITPLV